MMLATLQPAGLATPLTTRAQVSTHARLSRPALLLARRARCARTGVARRGDADVQVAQVQPPAEAESEFLEPFLRSLILGVGCAWVLESAHVALQFFGLLGGAPAGSLADLAAQLPAVSPPLFWEDHLAALAMCLVCYGLEAAAIGALSQGGAGPQGIELPTLQRLAQWPRKMLPLRLQLFKSLLSPARVAAASAAAASSTSSSAAVPPPPGPAAPASLEVPATPAAAAAAFSSAPAQPPASTGAAPTMPRPRAPRHAGGGSNILPLPGPVPTEEEQKGLTDRRSRKGLRPGELDPATSPYARRQRELLDRRSYLKNFWYVAALSQSVKEGKPTGVEMLGRTFVLFRGADGAVRCLDDVCPHRGAPLSGGWQAQVEGHECVVCPYHGWSFDGTGHLRDVPAAEGSQHFPQRRIQPSFPVEERGGFIWLFYGSDAVPAEERPPIPYVPELDDPEWKAVYEELEFDAGHFSVFENAIDMAHIHYLHSFGNAGKPVIEGMEATADAFSVTATFTIHNSPVNAFWSLFQVPEVHVTARAFLPSTSLVTFELGNGLAFTTFVCTTPVSANKSVNRFALVRKLKSDKTGLFNASLFDDMARQAMRKIQLEDKEMVERLRADVLPQEYSVRADLPQIMFRKLRQQWVDLGYGEPTEADADAPERFRSDF